MKNPIQALLLGLFLSSCAQSVSPIDVIGYQSPADADTAIRDTHHHNIIGEYNHRDPVDPKSWRKLNDDQAPKKGDGS